MIQVLKEGVISKVKRFECHHCGCIFLSNEYIERYTDGDGSKLTICHWVIEKCPSCKEIVKQLEAD